MLNFILKVKKTDIIKSLYIFLKNVPSELVNILKNLRFEFRDRFIDIFIFLGHIGFQKESHYIYVYTTNRVVISYLIL